MVRALNLKELILMYLVMSIMGGFGKPSFCGNHIGQRNFWKFDSVAIRYVAFEGLGL